MKKIIIAAALLLATGSASAQNVWNITDRVDPITDAKSVYMVPTIATGGKVFFTCDPKKRALSVFVSPDKFYAGVGTSPFIEVTYRAGKGAPVNSAWASGRVTVFNSNDPEVVRLLTEISASDPLVIRVTGKGASTNGSDVTVSTAGIALKVADFRKRCGK